MNTIQILHELQELNETALNGDGNALEAYIQCKTIEMLLKDVMNGLQPAAIEEAEKYGKGEHEAHGAKFQVKNGAARYDFKGVATWVEAKKALTDIEVMGKAMLKAGNNINISDSNTGEMVELPVQSFNRDILTIKI